jgi:hypothetical protein
MSTPAVEVYMEALKVYGYRILDVVEKEYQDTCVNATRYFYALYRKHWDGKKIGYPDHIELLEELLERHNYPLNRVEESGKPMFTLKGAEEFLVNFTESFKSLISVESLTKQHDDAHIVKSIDIMFSGLRIRQ